MEARGFEEEFVTLNLPRQKNYLCFPQESCQVEKGREMQVPLLRNMGAVEFTEEGRKKRRRKGNDEKGLSLKLKLRGSLPLACLTQMLVIAFLPGESFSLPRLPHEMHFL